MAVEIFNRYEDKYIVDADTFERIIKYIELHMEKDRYNSDGKFYRISNLYYDTSDYNIIRNSIQKPKYKEKLRLRAYGSIKDSQMVFLEIKKKYKGIVNKRRSAVSREEAEFFLKYRVQPHHREYMNSQVMNELEYFINHYRPEPKVYISYDRLAYFDCGSSDLRISFDKNIRASLYNSRGIAEGWGVPVLDRDLYLMEIKTRFAKPLWLVHLLNEEKIRRVSFSKYGSYYKMLLKYDYEDSCINL